MYFVVNILICVLCFFVLSMWKLKETILLPIQNISLGQLLTNGNRRLDSDIFGTAAT